MIASCGEFKPHQTTRLGKALWFRTTHACSFYRVAFLPSSTQPRHRLDDRERLLCHGVSVVGFKHPISYRRAFVTHNHSSCSQSWPRPLCRSAHVDPVSIGPFATTIANVAHVRVVGVADSHAFVCHVFSYCVQEVNVVIELET